MKRMVTYLFCALFLFSTSGSVFGVEKKDKKAKPQTSQQAKKKPAKATPKKPPKQPPPAKKPPAKKYDDFIDKNKNGIDDRRENLIKKSPPKKAPDKKSPS